MHNCSNSEENLKILINAPSLWKCKYKTTMMFRRGYASAALAVVAASLAYTSAFNQKGMSKKHEVLTWFFFPCKGTFTSLVFREIEIELLVAAFAFTPKAFVSS